MKVTGIMEVELVSVLKRKLEKVRDDIEWADPHDPRIEGLANEIMRFIMFRSGQLRKTIHFMESLRTCPAKAERDVWFA